MEAIKFKKIYQKNKISLIGAFLIFVLLYFVRINSFILIYQMQGFSLFIILFQIGDYIMAKKINYIFIEISNISFSIYLFHHKIIVDILTLNNPDEWYLHLILLQMTILLTLICSKIHSIVVNSLLESHIFKKIELIFI